MTQLELLLPFAMPPAEMARDLLRELNMPALATLLARAGVAERHVSDGFSRALPHEYWLARQFGGPVQPDANTSPALAVKAMQTLALPADTGVWFILQPVHLHIARDHLVLTDPRQLQLSEADARALFALAQALFEESGKTLRYGDAQTWFLRADDWSALQTSTPDAACGHNIDIWMPKGPHERDWRRLQNEIQMHWHAHAINEQRETRGLKPVNSIWLWGGASSDVASTQNKIEETFTFKNAQKPFAAHATRQIAITSSADVINAKPQHGLLVLDKLIEPAMAGDWSEWLARFQAMEAAWFAPLLDALKNGQLDKLMITISHNTACSSFSVGKSSLRKFWRKPSLARLAS
ncbi:hypothetical protein [Herminiimonas fonticola]|uniref:hypothetical protein n=1 Tax=Herminiimonas fonticola TaxID=303380 RepID=UPI00333EFF20